VLLQLASRAPNPHPTHKTFQLQLLTKCEASHIQNHCSCKEKSAGVVCCPNEPAHNADTQKDCNPGSTRHSNWGAGWKRLGVCKPLPDTHKLPQLYTAGQVLKSGGGGGSRRCHAPARTDVPQWCVRTPTKQPQFCTATQEHQKAAGHSRCRPPLQSIHTQPADQVLKRGQVISMHTLTQTPRVVCWHVAPKQPQSHTAVQVLSVLTRHTKES
jgi:hypothetical protein